MARQRPAWRSVSHWAASSAVLTLALFMPSWPSSASDAPAPSAPTVSVVHAQTGEIANHIRLTGSLVPRHESLVTVDLERGARIVSILGEVGDRVAQG
ncbi:hypothetical protein [Consotaella aegiceratis]|uniref:hypothetical protein n=1 Tax=Consotaella aegiceratis TaxID=3097961 RepID=UPI002F40BC51